MAQVQRPSLNRLLIQAQLNKFYSRPVARVSFGLVLTVLAVAFFGLVAIRPTLETMANLIKQIDDRKAVDAKLTVKISALASAQTELARQETRAQILDIAVPPSAEFPRLLKEIEISAAENGVLIGTLITQNVPTERKTLTETSTNLESIPLIVNVSGSYTGVLGMLSTLSNMRRVLLIDRVDILPPAGGETASLNMSVSLRAFAFGAPAPTPPRRTAR